MTLAKRRLVLRASAFGALAAAGIAMASPRQRPRGRHTRATTWIFFVNGRLV